MKRLTLQLFMLICCAAAPTIQAQELRIVEVTAPEINCLFDTTCRVTVADSSTTIPIPTRGSNFLQSRTLRASADSPAAGFYVYQYRVDLRNAVGLARVPCLSSLSLDFGPVVNALDLDSNGKAGDEVFVITRGGLGTVGLASAEKSGNTITFTFSSPVCAGGRPGGGESTFFFGLVSRGSPRAGSATVLETTGTSYEVKALVPDQRIRPRDKQRENSINGNSVPKQVRFLGGAKPVIRRLDPKPCVDRGGTVFIHGLSFGAQQDTRLVELGGHGIGVFLRVTSWSNTRITAIIPDDPRIQYGQWYYIGLQNQNRHWISNISRTINICRQLQ